MTEPVSGTNWSEIFDKVAKREGDKPFLWEKHDEAWHSLSWAEVHERVRKAAAGLIAQGIQPGDRVGLIAENRPEWAIADLAIMAAGAITVPAFTTYTSDVFAHVLNHAECSGLIFSGGKLAKTLMAAVERAPSITFLSTFDDLDDGIESAIPITRFADLGDNAPELTDLPGYSRGGDEAACFIFTSGTGGTPKAVVLTHRNLIANVQSGIALLEKEAPSRHHVFLSFLPLSHSYEHTAGFLLPISIGAEIYYAESVERLAENIKETRPTILPCVPRLHEVMRQKITARVNRVGGFKAKLFYKAVELGRKDYETPEKMNLVDRLANMALDRLVRKQVHEQFGGRMLALVSGGAPLHYDVGVFFKALGLPLLQGYGQTETSPLVAINPPSRIKMATVGPPLEGVEVKIAEDGEILVRGDNVMQGYWRDPEETAKAIKDGWLHTGDVGEFDEDGYLRITDRKKDLIVNSGGDNISPQRVEGVISLEPEVHQVLVYGDQRPHLVALIVPDQEFARKLAREQGLDADLKALVQEEAMQKAMRAAINRANLRLSAIEKVRRFHVMDEPFTVENGYMTPTLKLRRPLINKAYHELLEGLYKTGQGRAA
ncbi:MAG: AMP-dependent synthetase/ligase [Geminicoccaceae bacterium]